MGVLTEIKIEWYEALSLFLIYLCYASFMKFNVEIENYVKSKLFKQAALPEEVQIEQQSPIMQPTRDKSISFDTEIDHHDHHHHHHHNRSSLYRSDSLAIGRRRGSVNSRRQSIPILHSGAMFRNGIMQIMSHTLDPLTEGDVSEDRSRNGELTSPESIRRKISSSNRANGNFERLPLRGENGIKRDKSHDDNQCLYERRSTKAEIEQIVRFRKNCWKK
uniref:Uncharacterized protein n=1 Tax=Panagrolaimus davidi TaxID=227884 RepID=A0A914PUR3_9BILA